MAKLKRIVADVGFDAGNVFDYLEKQDGENPVKATSIKKDLDMSTSAVYLALGWLARENKVDIYKKRNSVQVQLR